MAAQRISVPVNPAHSCFGESEPVFQWGEMEVVQAADFWRERRRLLLLLALPEQ